MTNNVLRNLLKLSKTKRASLVISQAIFIYNTGFVEA
jgi:hypothetical protein